MPRIEIRPETSADHALVYDVEAAAFAQRNEADLVETLREEAQPHLSLVAELDGAIVGHVFFSPVTIETQPVARRFGALGPIAVDPAHQGRGIGSALVRAGLEQSPRHQWSAVFLVGNPAYYSRFGFVLAAPQGLTYGKPVFEPAFQLVTLKPGALDGCQGRVHFHTAFAAAEAA